MKKFKRMLVLSSSLLLIACGTNQETSESNEEEIQSEEEQQAAEYQTNSEENESPQNYHTQIDEDYLNQFDEIDEEMENDIQANNYTLESPYVAVNPYGTAPLTAIVAFESSVPAQAEVIIEGQTEETTVNHTVEEIGTEHYLPILGLYPDEANSVTIQLYDEDENIIEEEQLTIETDTLPENFWEMELAVESNEEAMEPGLTFMVPSRGNLFAVDSLGEVRYYLEPWMANTFTQLENGNFLIALRREEGGDYNQLVEMDRLGRPHQAIVLNIDNYDRVNIFHHDAIEDPDKNWLVAIHDGSEEYIEDEMAVLDRETGEILESMNFRNVFPESFYTEYSGPMDELGDWFHHNAFWLTQDEEFLLVSSRHQDATIKFSYPEGDFEWILASHENWPEELEEYLLDPIGELKFPGAQHAMMELPDQDGNVETMDIVLFDNNRVITRGDEELSDQFSRAVQYRINEEEMTVEEIWSYGEERGEDFFSRIVGDADYLPQTENVLITSGRIEVDEDDPLSRIVEVTREEEDEVVFEIIVSRFADHHGSRRQIYRAERLPLYTN